MHLVSSNTFRKKNLCFVIHNHNFSSTELCCRRTSFWPCSWIAVWIGLRHDLWPCLGFTERWTGPVAIIVHALLTKLRSSGSVPCGMESMWFWGHPWLSAHPHCIGQAPWAAPRRCSAHYFALFLVKELSCCCLFIVWPRCYTAV